MKLLSKFGYTPGMGLGKASQGRAEPVLPPVVKAGRGLAFDGSAALDELESRTKKRKNKRQLFDADDEARVLERTKRQQQQPDGEAGSGAKHRHKRRRQRQDDVNEPNAFDLFNKISSNSLRTTATRAADVGASYIPSVFGAGGDAETEQQRVQRRQAERQRMEQQRAERERIEEKKSKEQAAMRSLYELGKAQDQRTTMMFGLQGDGDNEDGGDSMPAEAGALAGAIGTDLDLMSLAAPRSASASVAVAANPLALAAAIAHAQRERESVQEAQKDKDVRSRLLLIKEETAKLQAQVQWSCHMQCCVVLRANQSSACFA